jgi:3D (Asp-Asp-Asp) domain-containing protein/peptidoglycan hydrolase CwlO-like protein
MARSRATRIGSAWRRAGTSAVLRCRVVPRETRTPRAWPLVLGALLALSGFVPATVAADSAATPSSQAERLSQQSAVLAGKSRSAVLDLYALDARLARERARLVALRIRTAEVRAARAAAQHRLTVARRSFSAAQAALAGRLQQLYEQGDTDPLAVVLGASSVDDALSSLDSLNRIADQDRRVIAQTRSARHRLSLVTQALAARERNLRALGDRSAQSMLALERAHSERASYLARLTMRQRLNGTAISELQQQALAVEARAKLLAVGRGAPSAGSSELPAGSTMTVIATGYSLEGHTATGAPVGWGVVAVDPSVIPLGTRLSVPGYGEGIAADTGSAVSGATIDLWFPTRRQAAAWGRRSITITLR